MVAQRLRTFRNVFLNFSPSDVSTRMYYSVTGEISLSLSLSLRVSRFSSLGINVTSAKGTLLHMKNVGRVDAHLIPSRQFTPSTVAAVSYSCIGYREKCAEPRGELYVCTNKSLNSERAVGIDFESEFQWNPRKPEVVLTLITPCNTSQRRTEARTKITGLLLSSSNFANNALAAAAAAAQQQLEIILNCPVKFHPPSAHAVASTVILKAAIQQKIIFGSRLKRA